MTVHSPLPCRFCGAPLSHLFLDLGEMPLANSYLKAADLAKPEPVYPLVVHVCDACLLVQAQPVVPAEHIFGDYAYFSSFSSSWLSHCARYCEAITSRLGLTGDSFVVEVASNDGYLLRNFVDAGIPCLGIEPAANVAAAAIASGVPTEVLFFGAETATSVRQRHRAANLIIANNVLAHVPDLNDFVAGFKQLLAEGGTVTVEFPHILELIRHVQFDTIYHEHYSYFSLYVLERVFKAHGLCLFDVESLSTHGGSLRIHACHDNDPRAALADGNLADIRAAEQAHKLDRPEGYDGMDVRVQAIVSGLRAFLADAAAQGKTVAAWGAAAKGNTLLNTSRITDKQIAFVVDRNPAKQNHYLPGSHIRVLPPEVLSDVRPAYMLILPWNLCDEISAEIRALGWEGTLVVAVPELRQWI